ncbi:hypothetical protein GDO78_019382 [Eleutherodactylus coqui]|uniref:G-protein coupled receptors family 1 profile domain-containing protein n=1 Tax=Eleutherodactylus coqui TaxID=57060 RepID=A0A8J6E981_ELECQ|nr:hypothetical protein GDO78_019382 [Eleutherodactylus coqui]
MINSSTVTEFFLLGFSMPQWLQTLLSGFYILLYCFMICGNIMIIIVVRNEPKLHLPMYFFIANFSFLEVWYTTTIVPRMIRDLIMKDKSIGFGSCIIQFYFSMVCGGNEHCLLAVLAYDRFIAICHPLYYNLIMKPKYCVLLILGAWLISFLAPASTAVSLYKMKYCGVNIAHFFCDIAPILQLTCTGENKTRSVFYMLAAIIVLTCFFMICMSYTFIVFTVIHIKSNEGRRNAFSTCASHLTVVAIFYSSCIFMYVRPRSHSNFYADKFVSLGNTFIAPVLNPMIYTFRNKAMKVPSTSSQLCLCKKINLYRNEITKMTSYSHY